MPKNMLRREDPPPRRNAGGGSQVWYNILKPLTSNKRAGRSYAVREYEEKELTTGRAAVSALNGRKLIIPKPDDVWYFTFRTHYEYDEAGEKVVRTFGRLYATYSGAE